MTPIEIIALVLIVVGGLKMLMLLINPKGFVNSTLKVMSNKLVTQFFGLIVAGVIFYYLRQAGFSIVDILAVTSFAFAMIIIAFAGEMDIFKTKYTKLIKRGRLWQEYWLYALIWIILMVWGVKELFF